MAADLAPLENSELYKYLGPLAHEISLVSYRKGDYLAYSDDCLDEIFYVLEGQIDVLINTENGRRFLVDEVPPGSFTGKISYLYDQHLCCDFLVSEPALLARIKSSTFKALEENPRFMKFFFYKTGRRIYTIYKQLLAKTLFRLEESLAYQILYNADEDVYVFDSMYSLADRLTVSRKNLYNVINRFVELGYIAKKDNSIRILNRPALLDLSKGPWGKGNKGECSFKIQI